MKARLVSFLWGFSEATFFFLVPDIWLSILALKKPRGIAVHVALAVLGAVAGGFIMYMFGAYEFAQARAFLDFVPAIGPAIIGEVGQQMQGGRAWGAMMEGGISGVPYKIYAVWAGHLGLPVMLFVVMSAAARAARFILIAGTVYAVGRVLRRWFGTRTLLRINAVCWAAFYAYYFRINGVF